MAGCLNGKYEAVAICILHSDFDLLQSSFYAFPGIGEFNLLCTI